MTTAIQVKVKHGEPVEKALKRLKRKVADVGVLKDLKDRRYFQKPSEKKRSKSAKARARRQKEAKQHD